MPYIPEKAKLGAMIRPSHVGELTFILTQACIDYLADGGGNFQTHAEVVAALECAKLEFYRRALAPYEDTKILANGDVYP